MKRLAATIGVALLLTTALALPAAAGRTTQFSTLEACYVIESSGGFRFHAAFEIKKGPLPDYVYVTVNRDSTVIVDSDRPDDAERNRLYEGDAVYLADPEINQLMMAVSEFRDPGSPGFAMDVQRFSSSPCPPA